MPSVRSFEQITFYSTNFPSTVKRSFRFRIFRVNFRAKKMSLQLLHKFLFFWFEKSIEILFYNTWLFHQKLIEIFAKIRTRSLSFQHYIFGSILGPAGMCHPTYRYCTSQDKSHSCSDFWLTTPPPAVLSELENKYWLLQTFLRISKYHTLTEVGKRNFFFSPQSQFRNLKEALPQSQFRNF